ncbi:MAG: M16 family metallopeptidase [Candidatus Ranarchaeia archaeon]|jgi:predicted Zn-dependent peptidase
MQDSKVMLHEISLPNGISVILDNRPWAKSVAISIGVRVGSRHGKEPGLIHASMQMLLQGTMDHTAAEIFTRIEGVGGTLGVTVNRDLTLIQTRVPKKAIDTGLKILYEIISSPAFSADAFRAIQNKMIAQILARENNGMQKSLRIAFESTYPNNPLGDPILGYPSSISDFELKTSKSTLESALDPRNLVIAVVGAFERNHLSTLLNQTFKKLKQHKSYSEQKTDRISHSPFQKQKEPLEISIESDEKTQAHIVLGIRAFPILDERLPALLLASHILGATMSSRLFTEIREIRGLAYTTYSTVSSYNDTGYAILYAGVRPDGISETISVFNGELEKIGMTKVPKEEFVQNRSHILGQIRLAHESPSFTANWLVINNIRRGCLTDPKEIRRQIENVTQEDILNVCKQIFLIHPRNITVVGAVDPTFQLPQNLLDDYENRGKNV